ncbi:MAG: F0F1 ATP synthase subunit delta [Actinomycetota bacterium]|nr:F0F1 ATP synthase subunit delta [Actinomycetota bacterium]
MTFNIWTFSFQVINFIVLLLILRRLLYRPVKEIIAKRRDAAQKTLEDAGRMRQEALEMKEAQKRETEKLSEIKTEFMEKMRSEAEEERKKLLLAAEKSAQAAAEKERALLNAEKSRAEEEVRKRAVRIVTAMASNLLSDISSESLHKSIWQNLFREAGSIVSRILNIRKPSSASSEIALAIRTAWPIGETEIGRLLNALESFAPDMKFTAGEIEDKALIAGVSIKAYDTVFDFSLAGQLEALATKLETDETVGRLAGQPAAGS